MANFWNDSGTWIWNLGTWIRVRGFYIIILGLIAVAIAALYFAVWVYNAVYNSSSKNTEPSIGSETQKFIFPETEEPTEAPTPAPTDPPEPTAEPIRNFISFVGSDKKSIVKYNNATKTIGTFGENKWILNLGTVILDYSLSENDDFILAGCMDNTAKYIDIFTFGGSVVFNMTGHTAPVGATAISSDGSRALTGSDDGTIKYWNLINKTLIGTINVPNAGDFISGITFIDFGKKAVVINDNVYVYDLEFLEFPDFSEGPITGTEEPITGTEPLIMSYNIKDLYGSAKYLSKYSETNFAVATESHVVVYDINHATEIGSSENRLTTGLFRFSGNMIGFSTNSLTQGAVYYENGSVNIISLIPDTGLKLQGIKKLTSTITSGMSNTDRNGVDFSKNGTLLTGGGIIWNVSTGAQMEYTCPSCIQTCDCGLVLWNMPRFFNL